MRACILAVSIVLASAAPARAEETVADDAAGVYWGFATFEVGTLATVAAIAFGDVCESWGCGLVLVAGSVLSMFAGGLAGGIAASADAPADVGFVVHAMAMGGLSLGMLAGGIADAAGADGDVGRRSAYVLAAVGAAGLGAYSFVRRDGLLRDPDATAGTNVLSWVSFAGLVAGISVAAAAELEDEAMLIVAGLCALAGLGAGIAIAEAGLAGDEGAAAAPLASWSAPF